MEMIVQENKKGHHWVTFCLWEYTGSNRGPSACKADALNQLSYTPNIFKSYSSNRGPWRVSRHALNQLSYTPFLKSGVQT